jgi:hypothetical protein
MKTSTDVLNKVTDDIRMNLEERQVTALVLLDFFQAFYTVVRALLNLKMAIS